MTKPNYKVISFENKKISIERTDTDGKVWTIPIDLTNSDYQRYLNKDDSEAALSTPIVTE